MVKVFEASISKIFNKNIEKCVGKYKIQYAFRLIVISLMAFLISSLNHNFAVSIILSLAIELYIVDLYTDRIMPPAFLCKSTYMHELNNSHILIKSLFLIVNGGVIIFLLMILLL